MKTAHRKAARAKQKRRGYFEDEPPLLGFGIVYDAATGRMRNWYQNAGGPKRWADNDRPMEECNEKVKGEEK